METLSQGHVSREGVATFNRTNLEWKQSTEQAREQGRATFNRTNLEWKLYFWR